MTTRGTAPGVNRGPPTEPAPGPVAPCATQPRDGAHPVTVTPRRTAPSLANEAERRIVSIARRLPNTVRAAADRLELLDGTPGAATYDDAGPSGSATPRPTEAIAYQRAWVTERLDRINDGLMSLIATLGVEGYTGLLSTIETAIGDLEQDNAATPPGTKKTCTGGRGLAGAFRSRDQITGADDSWGDPLCEEVVHALGVCVKHYRRYARWCLKHDAPMRERDPDDA